MLQFSRIILAIFCVFCYTVTTGQIVSEVDSIGVGNINAVASDSHGNLYYSCPVNHQIRMMDTNFVSHIIAGTGAGGFSGDNGPATNATLYTPNGLCVDSLGNVYIADAGNQRIRKIDAISGFISTVVGSGPGGPTSGGFSGDFGQATSAQLKAPNDVQFDNNGNLYIADYGNRRIRKVDTSGLITTVAGNGITGSDGDGGPATNARIFPDFVMFDSFGNLYITQANYTIRKVSPSGIISTIAGDTSTKVYNGDNIPATSAHLYANWMTLSQNGTVYYSDGYNCMIRYIDDTGYIHTVVGNGVVGSTGNGGSALDAAIEPTGIAFDKCNNLYFGETYSVEDVRKVSFNPSCFPLKEQEISEQDINIYPNPATSELTIEGAKGGEQWVLLNILGIIEQSGTLKTGSNTLPILHLPPGIKILQITTGETQVRKRFVKE